MKINLDILRQNVVNYLQQPEGRKELTKNSNSMLANVAALLCFTVLGLLLICTVFLAKIGWQLASESFMSIVSGTAFQDPAKATQAKIESAYICIASPVMVGPEGFGLLLFSESKQAARQPKYLAKKARLLFRVYSGEGAAADDTDSQLATLLGNDTFVHGRIRMVPENHSDGQRLALLDCEIDSEYLAQDTSGGQLVLCAYMDMTHDEDKRRGRVVYLPWHLVDSAIES